MGVLTRLSVCTHCAPVGAQRSMSGKMAPVVGEAADKTNHWLDWLLRLPRRVLSLRTIVIVSAVSVIGVIVVATAGARRRR